MATIKIGTTKIADRLIRYAEKRSTVTSALNCEPRMAKEQWSATRSLWGKKDGIQAHHIIQSFKPGEVTPKEANQVGLELVKKLFKSYEVLVFTHSDKAHIHNHIIINSVNIETGKKLHYHGKKALKLIRDISDKICKAHGLSVIEQKKSEIRYTLHEKALLQKGKKSWKDEIRQCVEMAVRESKSYEEFKTNMKKEFDIDIIERGKNNVFIHPENKKHVRGKTLGSIYEREAIKDGIKRQNSEREKLSRARQVIGNGIENSREKSNSSGSIERESERNDFFERNTFGTSSTSKGKQRIRKEDPRISKTDRYQSQTKERIEQELLKTSGEGKQRVSKDKYRKSKEANRINRENVKIQYNNGRTFKERNDEFDFER